jgi:hypothetical protein
MPFARPVRELEGSEARGDSGASAFQALSIRFRGGHSRGPAAVGTGSGYAMGRFGTRRLSYASAEERVSIRWTQVSRRRWRRTPTAVALPSAIKLPRVWRYLRPSSNSRALIVGLPARPQRPRLMTAKGRASLAAQPLPVQAREQVTVALGDDASTWGTSSSRRPL